MTCLETSFLVDLLRDDDSAVEYAAALDDAGERATVTPVSAAELWLGAQLGTGTERRATAELVESLTWLEFSRGCARLAGEIQADLVSDGEPIGFTDCLIAAVAMEHGEVLVTNDAEFGRIDGLESANY